MFKIDYYDQDFVFASPIPPTPASRARADGHVGLRLLREGMMETIQKLEAIEPFYQGELDGLCGVYAIINAVRLLCPELDEQTTKKLFKRLLATLHKREANPVTPVWRGMRMRTLRRIAKEARRFMKAECGITLRARRWRPERRERITTVKLFWHAVERELSRHRVPIIGFGGKVQHWTVVRGLTPKLMKLCDSSDLTAVRRKGCRLPRKGRGFDSSRYLLFASQVLVIKRLSDKRARHA